MPSLTGCKAREAAAPETAVAVEAAQPTQGPIAEEIAADAILAPLSQAAIAPRISAPIRAEYVQRGARVRRGQLLVSLEDRDLQGSALDSQGALLAAEAGYTATTDATIPEDVKKSQLDVEQLQAARDIAHRTAEERRKLFLQGALSGRDADTAAAAEVQAQAALETAQKHLDSVLHTTRHTSQQAAQGTLTSARGRLRSAEAQVSYSNLRSPIDGVVTERPLFPGETASAGAPIITVMDTSALLAKLHLAQATAQKLSVGHHADVHIPGVDAPAAAVVSFISPALDPGSTTVEVWLKLPNPDGHLKVGTPVHAVMQGTTLQNALQIPTDAVLPSPGSAQDGGAVVLVVSPDGTAHTRPITIGIRTAESAQITSGLSPTDLVVTSGGYGLEDGAKVTVGKPGAPAGDKAPAKPTAGDKD